ncbi:uncharacterized protein LOC143188264 [Calliopsis andreniformis]|uniref:uncharacterized protein LOC143188264 n=1 Tax=Calliopsis andreniformis TaxID=337506 RepID=UPI003FCCE8A6
MPHNGGEKVSPFFRDSLTRPLQKESGLFAVRNRLDLCICECLSTRLPRSKHAFLRVSRNRCIYYILYRMFHKRGIFFGGWILERQGKMFVCMYVWKCLVF